MDESQKFNLHSGLNSGCQSFDQLRRLERYTRSVTSETDVHAAFLKKEMQFYNKKCPILNPKGGKVQKLPLCRFSCKLCTISSFYGLEVSKRSKMTKIDIQYAFLMKCFASITLMNDPKLVESQKNFLPC